MAAGVFLGTLMPATKDTKHPTAPRAGCRPYSRAQPCWRRRLLPLRPPRPRGRKSRGLRRKGRARKPLPATAPRLRRRLPELCAMAEWARAQSPGAVEEILDRENKRMADSLASKVTRLKSLALDIDRDAEDQNCYLDGMVIHRTQDMVAANILLPWCLLIPCGLLEGK
ncbi:BET1-like protein isoform X2 [Hippopotamus amphibius kiboko]|uniref:BET1-like protein isoform X2 n=1 Tax=Hippopotamus amphibius kiboko TaxID=575201 RepID=UPI0025968A52|nr:BET1-like protein isoform X2 [Hippopotamus amphibius kiboko]